MRQLEAKKEQISGAALAYLHVMKELSQIECHEIDMSKATIMKTEARMKVIVEK